MDKKQTAVLLGQKLQNMRIEKGLSIRKLAQISNVSPSSIKNIERGSIHITYTKYINIASGLGLSLCEMFSLIEK